MTNGTERPVGGRFVLVELRKTGGGVSTHRAVDTLTGGPVIVKIVATAGVSTAVRLRLEHEAYVLEKLDLPTGPPLLASGYEGDRFFLVQRLLDGVTLRERLTAGPLSVMSTIDVAVGVLRVLDQAHDLGVFHRDVKPANIIFSESDGQTAAHLVDFGLAFSSTLDVSLRDEPVGTARYIAPEAAGLINATVDQRADLYSLGIVLFECLAGAPPFSAPTVGEVLRQHLNHEPASLRTLGLSVPRALDGVVHRLLGKDPETRYQSSAAVLADLQDIRDALSAGIVEPSVTPGRRDRRHALTEPSFVGRVAELESLIHLVDEAGVGRGGVVLVEAESGGGKSRLLDELALQAGQQGAWVLRGQGVDHAAQRPFQVLDGIVNGIVSASVDEGLGQQLRVCVGARAEAVVAALPGLSTTMGVDPDAAVGPEAYGEARSVDALSSLLDGLGSGSRPALVLLDDCQWADGLTISLLDRWQARQGTDLRHVLVVAAFRSEEVPSGHPLRSLLPLGDVALSPFVPADVETLCGSMAGPLPPAALSTIIRLAEGSPFMASAVLRGMVESGALRDAPDGWEVDPAPMSEAQTSRRAALFLARRLELLEPDALALLSVGAVLGKEFELDLAVALAGEGASGVTKALDQARRRQILWVDEDEGRCTFTHDKLRETLLGRLDPDERRALHERAGASIEALDPDRVFELAYHFDAADRSARALPFALRAAELARARHALDAAATQYRIASRAAGEADDPRLRMLIAQGLGEVLTLQGEYREAAVQLQHALGHATDAVDRAVIESKLGDVAFKRGDQEDAARHLEGALRDLGCRVPRTSTGFVVAFLRELLIQVAHTLMPRVLVGRRPIEGADHEFLAIRMYSRLTYVYWFSAGKVACGWSHLREMNLAERYPPGPERAQAYSEHAPVMTIVPWYGRGRTYARRSLMIRRDLGDVWGQGQSLNFSGVVAYAASSYDECKAHCWEAIRLLERTGDRWEQNTATWHLVFSHHRLGELEAAVSLARDLYRDASAIGDQTAAGVVLGGWARASSGRVPASLIAAELARDTGDAQTGAEVRMAEGLRLLFGGDVDAGVRRLEEAVEIVAAAGLRQEYVAPVKPWLATGLRMQVEALDQHAVAARRARLRRASKVARQAARLSRSYRNNRPHALRELGVIASLRGHDRAARRHLAASLAIAERQGAVYEAALSREAMARVDVAAGRGDAAELESARAARSAMEPADEMPTEVDSPQPTLSLTDRFELLLVTGRRIGSAPSPAAVFDAVREAALLLLRGERCHVLELPDGVLDDITTASGERLPDLSRGLLLRTVDQRVPLVANGGEEGVGDSTESLVLSGMSSVLCAPILCDDEVVACFYVTHRQVNGLFGELEIQLAEFIGTLAGAALEHVAGSEALYRSLAQNSSDVVTIVSPGGVVTYQSASVERVFGYAPDELLDTDLRDWLHPQDLPGFTSLLDAVDGASAALVEGRMRHRDGSWRTVETTVTPMFGVPGVSGLVLNSRDISERVTLEAELRHRASHDPLTGLANRALFADRVSTALHRTEVDPRHSFAVVFLDLDDFKSINDTLGHAAGDLLLRGVGERLEMCVRPGDTVARFGGDEFALLLEGARPDLAESVVKRIIADLVAPFLILDQEVHARASVGLAFSAELRNPEDLLSGADAAMYVAKARGKSRYELFDPGMRDAVIERASLRRDLEWALEREELRVHYQPVLDVASAALVGFEALVRWEHPRRGLLGPGEFVDLAEESGFIVAIGEWVLRRSCEQLREWRRELGLPLTMAVNVSARQLVDPGFFGCVERALASSRLDPADLVLEITESATVEDTDAVLARLAQTKALGVAMAIDDFGTGYSSLSYLRRFPVDQLKLDRSFVAGVTTSPEDVAIVRSVINLGHALGMRIVAEGVETVDQLDKLCEMGCDMAQGFNWLRPADAPAISTWLELHAGIGRVAEISDVRVLLADDRDGVRATLRVAFEVESGFDVVGDAPDASTAIRLAGEQQPDLILLDVAMPDRSGIDALPELRLAAPAAKIVLLTALEPAQVLTDGGDAADAVLDKTRGLDGLVDQMICLFPGTAISSGT